MPYRNPLLGIQSYEYWLRGLTVEINEVLVESENLPASIMNRCRIGYSSNNNVEDEGVEALHFEDVDIALKQLSNEILPPQIGIWGSGRNREGCQ